MLYVLYLVTMEILMHFIDVSHVTPSLMSYMVQQKRFSVQGYLQFCSTDKTIPLQAWTAPEGSRSLRLTDFMTVGTWRWQGCQPYIPANFTAKEIFLVLISVRDWVSPSAAGRIMSMKNSNDTMGRIELATFRLSTVPQPTALLCAPLNNRCSFIIFGVTSFQCNFFLQIMQVCMIPKLYRVTVLYSYINDVVWS